MIRAYVLRMIRRAVRSLSKRRDPLRVPALDLRTGQAATVAPLPARVCRVPTRSHCSTPLIISTRSKAHVARADPSGALMSNGPALTPSSTITVLSGGTNT